MWQAVEAVTGKIRQRGNLAGGDINILYRLHAEKGDFVIKTHRAPPPGLYASEALGLCSLRDAGLDTPEVLAHEEAFLLMEYLEPGNTDMVKAGEMLAALHSIPTVRYGFTDDTYLATLLQSNRATDAAADFHFYQRLEPLLGGSEQAKWEKFFEKTAPLLHSCPHPSLLHGDLWGGNLYHAARGPVFIDPAVYWGDALIDIAMTKLFGGFGRGFYDAYTANSPSRDAADDLISIFQIYPLLVHAKLFGGGYYRNAVAIRDRFL
jgi:fructosamine-3-kinase